jgi:hypothetical protein
VKAGITQLTISQIYFCDAGAEYCTDAHLLSLAQLTGAGTAAFKFRPGPGSHTYKAVFAGTTYYESSTSPSAMLTVSRSGHYQSNIELTPRPGASASNYSLTATVGGSAASAPTGKVSFFDKSYSAQLGTATLSPNSEGGPLLKVPTAAPSMYATLIAVGDFNGDGIPDLVVETTGGLAVLQGNGDGTFGTVESIGGFAIAMAAADFNGDGNLDLAVLGEEYVTIYLGNGEGTFVPHTVAKTGSKPVALAVGDFNEDGVPDMVVANSGSDTLTILLANGNGTFTATSNGPQTFYTPTSVSVTGLGGGGHLGLAVQDGSGGAVTFFSGDGTGNFAEGETIEGLGSDLPVTIALGDFASDGNVDVAATNWGYSDVEVFFGAGPPSFTYGTGIWDRSITTGDFNGDGILDLATADRDQGVTVLLGTGSGDAPFVGAGTSSPSVPSVESGAGPIAAGDFNGDGNSDIATVTQFSDSAGLEILLAGQAAASAGIGVALTPGSGTHQVVASYLGDNNYAASASAAVTLTAPQGTPTVTVTAPAHSVFYGSPATLEATVKGTGLKPTGTVYLDDNGEFLTVGTLTNGVFPYVDAKLAVGYHAIVARYQGDANYLTANSPAANFTVIAKQNPTVEVTSSASSATFGALITFTAKLTGIDGMSTGTLQFFDGMSRFDTVNLNSSGIATRAEKFTVGEHTITASYEGNAIYAAAKSNALKVKIDKATPTVTLKASATTVKAGAKITFKATLSGAGATPTGMVKFLNGDVDMAGSAVNSSGVLTYSTSKLAVGKHTITAVYAGNGNYEPKTSAAVIVTISVK